MRAGLAAARGAGAPDRALMLIHDGARPCVSAGEIDAVIDAASDAGDHGALLALPVTDTLKRRTGQQVQGTVDRNDLARALTPQAFSFNSPQGMCEACNGLGTQVAFDPDLLVPDTSRSLNEGALKLVGKVDENKNSMGSVYYRQVFAKLKIPLDKPWKKLTKTQQHTFKNIHFNVMCHFPICL